VNRCGGVKEHTAYKGGVYAPAVKLEVLLGPEALERGRKRHEKIAADCAVFFVKNTPARQPTGEKET